jgi:hypothetical protein
MDGMGVGGVLRGMDEQQGGAPEQAGKSARRRRIWPWGCLLALVLLGILLLGLLRYAISQGSAYSIGQ